MKTGFIGLGAMGAPMARHVHSRGLLTVVGTRTQDKADALAAELGVRAARSAQNFADCDVVALCVPLDADVLENVAGLAADETLRLNEALEAGLTGYTYLDDAPFD